MSEEKNVEDKILNVSKGVYNEKIVESLLGIDGFCKFTYPNNDRLIISIPKNDDHYKLTVCYTDGKTQLNLGDIGIFTDEKVAIKDFLGRLTSDTPWTSSIKSETESAEEKKPQRIFYDNLVAVDKGALQMVVNVMRRAGKDEIIEAFLESCVDIEDVVKHYNEKHQNLKYEIQVEKELYNCFLKSNT
jgi:hypothetical protein